MNLLNWDNVWYEIGPEVDKPWFEYLEQRKLPAITLKFNYGAPESLVMDTIRKRSLNIDGKWYSYKQLK